LNGEKTFRKKNERSNWEIEKNGIKNGNFLHANIFEIKIFWKNHLEESDWS